jgi:hypothetical protein
MSNPAAAKERAKELFDFVVRCYPDAIIGLDVPDSPTAYRIYLYGVMRTVMKLEMDDYEKMHLLNMLKDTIGLSADELAADILKYIDEQ